MANLCINCEHHREQPHKYGGNNIEHICMHPDAKDPVTGEAVDCWRERSLTNPSLPSICGVHGSWFKQKQYDTPVGIFKVLNP